MQTVFKYFSSTLGATADQSHAEPSSLINFLHFFLTQCKSTRKPPSTRLWLPFLPVPLHFKFLKGTTSLPMTDKSQLAPRGQVHTAQHIQGINSNHFQKNMQAKERQDRPRNSPSASSHLRFREFPNLRGCLCVEKASTNLSHHLGIYINFINSILGQRFHTLVGCDKNRPYLF